MTNPTLVLCGGTGAHTAVALLRLHILGHPLGFFGDGRFAPLPDFYLIDQDAGDSAPDRPTAWQRARRLLDRHPALGRWEKVTGVTRAPQVENLSPLPKGADGNWYSPTYSTLDHRFEGSSFLPYLTSELQRQIDYARGMMGSPALGALLFRLKLDDERASGLNRDEQFDQMLQREGRIVVAGSGVGGTGASVGPTVAKMFAAQERRQVMAVMILRWFHLLEEGSDEVRERAQRRNRRMIENAHSALQYYGQSLSRKVAAVPVGMPDSALVARSFTGDTSQPIKESFVHAVAALAAFRHFLREEPYDPGLYMMGAEQPGRLNGGAEIPGGTLQALANRAATLVDLLEIWSQVLDRDHSQARVRPAIHQAVAAKTGSPPRVAQALAPLIAHYREQMDWLENVLGIEGAAFRAMSRETLSRRRLRERDHRLAVAADSSPEEVALALFDWTAGWIRDTGSTVHALTGTPAPADGMHWPEQRDREALGVVADRSGELHLVQDANRHAVISGYVEQRWVTENGWPHPLAAIDHFRHAVARKDPEALLQLELLLVGVASETLEVRRLEPPEVEEADPISLERLLAEARRESSPGVMDLVICEPESGQPIGFSSPHTLLCPVPVSEHWERGYEVWDRLWRKLTGSEDDRPWTEAPVPAIWTRDGELGIQQVRSWIEQQKKLRRASAPSWTRIFEWRPELDTDVPFGFGEGLQVYWGEELVEVNLPQREVERWDPTGLPEISREELVERVPDLLEIRDETGERSFWKIELEVPDEPRPLDAWWRGHLEELRRRQQIHIYGRNEADEVVLGVMTNGVLHAGRLSRSRLLSPQGVSIGDVTPMEQDPVDGSAAGTMLYPDLPLRSDYLDLVRGGDGERLLEHLVAGEQDVRQRLQGQRPVTGTSPSGRSVIRWKLDVRGRRGPLELELPLPESEHHHRAHWMVWPRFRTRAGDRWRAYYVYDHCSDGRLVTDVLWLDPSAERGRFRRRRKPSDRAAFPVAYELSAEGAGHRGGPPLALVLRRDDDVEQGIYLVQLQPLAEGGRPQVSLGLDFGTSHSTAALQVGQGPIELLELTEPLSHHVSQDLRHVEASPKEDGLLRGDRWLPTYRSSGSPGMLPSELVLLKKVAQAEAEDVGRWAPVEDYLVPSMRAGREDRGEYLVTDLKWREDRRNFLGKGDELREHYLSMLLELAVADAVAGELRSLPTGPIDVTITYPLRSGSREVELLGESLDRVLERCRRSLGLDFQRYRGIGLFDESRAGRISGNNRGEVTLVADLGGGSLDLFISAGGEHGQTRWPTVADSVRLGGNRLLRQIAENSSRFLPSDGNWNSSDIHDTETKLRSWIRTLGAPKLFGVDAGARPHLPEMEIFGYRNPVEGDAARALIDRYFRLMVEYLARNLVAYLLERWYPTVPSEDHDRLRISVQLRGNGWGLRHQGESVLEAHRVVQGQVRERVEELWQTLDDPPYSAPGPGRWQDPARYLKGDAGVKTDLVCQVVRRAEDPQAVERDWSTHTLVDLELQEEQGPRRMVPWVQSVPFHTGRSKDLELQSVEPEIRLSESDGGSYQALRELPANVTGDVNGKLRDEGLIVDGGHYRAPVSALVWEAIFGSREYWPET